MCTGPTVMLGSSPLLWLHPHYSQSWVMPTLELTFPRVKTNSPKLAFLLARYVPSCVKEVVSS